jgi:uncharacterized protein involved in type VI secretion and phage assembly
MNNCEVNDGSTGGPTGGQKYYGKYRGTVVNNIDPLQIGRLMVQVPDVEGLFPSSWAMPCFPISGRQMGAYMIPQTGAGVWVEFEQGDPDYPIWSGCWYGSSAEVPTLALSGNPLSPNVVLQTGFQNAIVISDLPGPTGGIMLKSTSGATIIVNDTGIYIQNGKGASLVMVGPTVTINQGALVVV